MSATPSKRNFKIVIIGGGTAGITVAARLAKKLDPAGIAIIEPSREHFYQPLWTLVGGGVVPREKSRREEASLIPRGVAWIQDKVAEIDPAASTLSLGEGGEIGYEHLVVAAGIQLDWHKVKGLEDALGRGGVCSNYGYDTAPYTWETIREFKGGTALFTHPNTPIKCGGAPQKIMYLADDMFIRNGVRAQSRVVFALGPGVIFSAPKYAETLLEVIVRKQIETLYQRDLVEVRGEEREAVFQNLATGESETIPYDMLHVTPPMSAPDFLSQSPLGNEGGWVDVDRHSLRHVRFDNVFALGDCSSLPTSKTGAAVRAQAPVLVQNLLSALAGEEPKASYNGYTSCPLVTGYGKLVLAEFDYDGKPTETFPFDQNRERWSMYQLKRYLLPILYWDFMLKGRA